MSTAAIRDRLVYPVAVVVALGAVTSVQAGSPAAPRLAAVSAIRLQAEVSAFVSGLTDQTVAALASTPRAAASGVPAAAAPASPAAASSASPAAASSASAVGATWPSTFLDKLVASLPEEIQYAILPPLYVVMSVVGAIMGVFYLIFGFPKDVMSAAAAAPKRGPAAALDVVETIGVQSDSPTTSATPGVAAGDRATVGESADVSSAPTPALVRGGHPVPADATTTAAVDKGAATSAVAEPFPAASAGGTAPVAVEAPAVTEPASGPDAPGAPAVDVAVEQASSASSVDESPTAVSPPARVRARSADDGPGVRARSADDGPAKSAPSRAVRRSAQ